MVIWIYSEKAFDSFQYTFIVLKKKNTHQSENISQQDNAISQPTENSGVKCWKPPHWFWNQTKMLTVTASVQHSIGIPSHFKKRRNKMCPIWKERGKPVICRWHDTHWKDWCWSSNTLAARVKNWVTGKDPDAGKNWRQGKKVTTEDKMVGWHHRLDGHEFEQALGVDDGQGSLVCCSPWGHREIWLGDWTQLNDTLCRDP